MKERKLATPNKQASFLCFAACAVIGLNNKASECYHFPRTHRKAASMRSRVTQFIPHNFSALHYEPDFLQFAHVRRRITRGRHDIGKLARLDGSNPVLP